MLQRARSQVHTYSYQMHSSITSTESMAGEKPWADRKALVVNELKFNALYNAESFVCLQEVLNTQLTDVMSSLGSECKIATRCGFAI